MTTTNFGHRLGLTFGGVAIVCAAFALGYGVGNNGRSSDKTCDPLTSKPTSLQSQPLPGTGERQYGQIFEMDGASR